MKRSIAALWLVLAAAITSIDDPRLDGASDKALTFIRT
jgi:hypothetical protein